VKGGRIENMKIYRKSLIYMTILFVIMAQ